MQTKLMDAQLAKSAMHKPAKAAEVEVRLRYGAGEFDINYGANGHPLLWGNGGRCTREQFDAAVMVLTNTMAEIACKVTGKKAAQTA